MKRIFTILALAAAFMALSVQTANAGPAKRLVNKVIDIIETLEDSDNTFAGAQMNQITQDDNIKTYTRTLYSGNDYMAIAIGDNRIHDTDLVVYRRSGDSWIEVGRDADTSNTAIVSFHCNSTGEYKFEIKAYSFESGYTVGLYGFVLTF